MLAKNLIVAVQNAIDDGRAMPETEVVLAKRGGGLAQLEVLGSAVFDSVMPHGPIVLAFREGVYNQVHILGVEWSDRPPDRERFDAEHEWAPVSMSSQRSQADFAAIEAETVRCTRCSVLRRRWSPTDGYQYMPPNADGMWRMVDLAPRCAGKRGELADKIGVQGTVHTSELQDAREEVEKLMAKLKKETKRADMHDREARELDRLFDTEVRQLRELLQESPPHNHTCLADYDACDYCRRRKVALAPLPEDTDVVLALADSSPVFYEEWLEPVKGPGFFCPVCKTATAEREPGFNGTDLLTARHTPGCAWRLARLKLGRDPGRLVEEKK